MLLKDAIGSMTFFGQAMSAIEMRGTSDFRLGWQLLIFELDIWLICTGFFDNGWAALWSTVLAHVKWWARNNLKVSVIYCGPPILKSKVLTYFLFSPMPSPDLMHGVKPTPGSLTL
jgi:hypothetical protein